MRYIIIAFFVTLNTGCNGSSPVDTVSSQTVRDLLEGMGWVVPGLPSGQYSPGTIVTVENGKLVAYGSAAQCIQNAELLEKADPVAIALEGSINRSRGWNFNAFIEAYGLTAGPNAKSVQTANLRIGDAQVESLARPLALADHLWVERANLSPACSQTITNPDGNRLYIVSNAIAASGYHYEFAGERGSGITLDASNLSQYVQGLSNVGFVGKTGITFTASDISNITAGGVVYIGYQNGPAVTPNRDAGATPAGDTIEEEIRRQQALLGR